jgi:phosphocarrier protein
VIKRTVTLCNQLGLHARAASKLVQCATSFESEVWLSFQDKRVNAKSIMGVLLLGAPCGSELIAEVEGADEDKAIAALEQLIEDRFGEAQ